MENHTDTRSERLISHLVGLCGIRGRDALLAGVTHALADTVPVRLVEISSLVLDENQRFWLPLTQARADAKVRFVSDPLRTDPDALTPIAAEPERWRCLDQAVQVTNAPTGERTEYLTRFPIVLAEGATPWGVAEFHSEAPLRSGDEQAVRHLLRVYGSMLDMLDYSECDALTGLWNRKPFDDLFYKALPIPEPEPLAQGVVEHRGAATTATFWLAMVDIDHFKMVNDTYGHLIGDEVLLLVARILKASFRASDRVYRFGGEEFIVILRCNGHESAVAAAERFRASMAGYDFPQAGRITASVGITEIVAGDLPSSACERADQAVYYAKHHGRNQVCSEADLVRRGLLTSDQKIGDVELF